MKGDNELSLCEAAMIEIAQEWVDRNIASKPRVTEVRTSTNPYGGFIVKLASSEEKAA